MGLHSVDGGARTLSPVIDRFLEQYFLQHPVNATFTGMHAHDHRLPDWSRAARAADAVAMQRLHSELAAAHPLPATAPAAMLRDDDALLDAELARANLEVRLAEHASGLFHDRNPALWTGEAIFGAVSLMIRSFASQNERLPALTSRLEAIGPFLDEMQRVITGPVPRAWTERASRESAAAIALFGDGIEQWLVGEECSADRVSALRAAAACARAAFSACQEWLTARLAAKDDAVCCGSGLFDVLLRRGHYCDRTPAELLLVVRAEIVREQSVLQAMLAARGWTLFDAQRAMAADHPNVDDYQHAFARRWAECRAFAQARDAVHWPDWPIRYVPIPQWARAAAPSLYWLFYRSPAPMDRYDVHDYVVAPIDASMPIDEQQRRLALWNHSVITLNHVVHHGSIGHHVQNWHAYHQSRSRLGTMAAVDCASRIGMFLGGSMAEGWACYATGLMEEFGLLTPLERLSEQHSRVRMLARAIVDIELHVGAFSLDDAKQFYRNEVGMPVETAAAEANKNSMFPCTAVMYWLGTQAIRDVRDRLHARDGTAFSLRTFHDALLSRGSVPVLLVASLLEAPAA